MVSSCPCRPARRESGQALVLALVAVLLLSAALALAAGTLVARMKRSQREAVRIELLALADAAVAETLADLAAWPVSAGVAPRRFGGGTIESTVQRGGAQSFTIVARASVGRQDLSVEVLGRMTELGPRVDAWRRLPPAASGPGGSFQGLP